MSKLLVLSKLMIKSYISSINNNKKGLKVPPFVLILLLIFIFASSISFPLFKLTGFIYDGLAKFNQQGTVLTLALVAVSAATFLFGILYVLTIFYFSKDVEFFLPMPIKPSAILGAKLFTALVYEYMTEAIFLIPIVLNYGIKSGANIIYYIYSVIVFLILPIIPLVLASIINIIIMRFTNIGKHKDALRIIGGLLAFGLVFGGNMYLQSLGANKTNPDQFIKLFVSGDNSLAKLASKYFPSVRPASLALIYNNQVKGITNLLLFIAITAVFIIVFFLLGEKMYFKGVLGNAEIYSKRKNLSEAAIEKATKQNLPIITYTFKELKILFRTPAYLMNCVIINFIWPVITVFGMFGANKGQSENIGQIANLIKDNKVLGIALAFIFAMGIVVAGTNGVTSTSISREGQNVFFNKYIPMKYKDQIAAKVLSGMLLSGFCEAVILILAVAYIKPQIYLIIPALILMLEGTLITCLIGIALDLKFPKLKWDSEQRAVKQNFNLMITMFSSWAVAILTTILMLKLQLSLWYAFGILLVIGTLINVILCLLLSKAGVKWFEEIEA